MNRPATLCMVLSMLATVAAQAAEIALRHDPFRRPDLSSLTGASPTHGPNAPVPEKRPQLRGVIVAGEASVANIDGLTVPLGGEVGGYRLERIAEDGVRLRKGPEVILLRLDAVPEATR